MLTWQYKVMHVEVVSNNIYVNCSSIFYLLQTYVEFINNNGLAYFKMPQVVRVSY